jgi:drug/metabolite transporter (DMT)-like permease
MISRVRLGVGCALAAAGIYGLIPSLVRGAFENGIPPVEATFFRTSVIAIAFALIAVVQGESFRVPRAARGAFAGQALATLVISVSYLASVQFIPIGLAVIIFFTFPVLIMLASPMVEGKFPGFWRIVIAIFAFGGLVVAIGPSFGDLDIRGIGLAALASLAGVVQFFTGRAISRYLKPAVFGSLVHLVIWPATLLVALYVGNGTLQMMPGGAGTITGFHFLLGLAAVYVAAYMLQMSSLRFAPASTVAPFYNLEPIVTTAWAGLLFGERLSLNQYAGGGIVLAALVVSSLLGKRENKA